MSFYDEYVYELPQYTLPRDGATAPTAAFFNGRQSIPGSSVQMGFTVIEKEMTEGFPHFHHSREEYYMFSGADLCNFFDFDAEIELWMGEDPDEMEKYTITKPMLIRIPENMWHGPIRYKRVGKPVAFSACFMDGDLGKITRVIRPDDTVEYPFYSTELNACRLDASARCTGCGKCVQPYLDDPTAAPDPALAGAFRWARDLVEEGGLPWSGKYDKYLYEYPVEWHSFGDMYANPRGKFKGVTQMPGARFFGGFSVALKPNPMEVPHIHTVNDEYLWFIGSNLADPLDYDGEVELMMGWDPDHMEKLTLTKPCVVRVPANMWHCPILFKRVDKPIAFFPLYPDGDWSKIVRRKREDGTDEYLFEAASLRKCVYDTKKFCVYCGKCYRDKSLKVRGGIFTYKKKGE